jgi:hypothetical protein
MDPKNRIKDDVEAALLKLHQKIDFLQQKVEKLCESTQECRESQPMNHSKEKKSK